MLYDDRQIELIRDLWRGCSKRDSRNRFSGELVDEYGNKNSYYFEQFEKDLEYINSLDSYQFLEWLEKAEPVTIDNYLIYIEHKNTKKINWLKRVLNFIGAPGKHINK
jgi:hypothetical protein